MFYFPNTGKSTGCGPINLDNGSVLYNNNNTTAKFRCDNGYIKVGARALECISGQWNAEPPVCEGIKPVYQVTPYIYL